MVDVWDGKDSANGTHLLEWMAVPRTFGIGFVKAEDRNHVGSSIWKYIGIEGTSNSFSLTSLMIELS